jgi:diguanylate cyclase (GGDEF)-like protein
VDVDGLKDVNDRYGHEAGDNLLRDFAGVLTDTFRESDVVARVGGDEFCVFGAELNLNPDVLQTRLDYNIARFNAEHPDQPPLSASAGVWRCPFGRDEPLDTIVARADQAMYERKRARRKSGVASGS